MAARTHALPTILAFEIKGQGQDQIRSGLDLQNQQRYGTLLHKTAPIRDQQFLTSVAMV